MATSFIINHMQASCDSNIWGDLDLFSVKANVDQETNLFEIGFLSFLADWCEFIALL